MVSGQPGHCPDECEEVRPYVGLGLSQGQPKAAEGHDPLWEFVDGWQLLFIPLRVEEGFGYTFGQECG